MIRKLLIRHEGLRLKPYRCTKGKLTIAVGRNLEDVGITKDEALTLLENDIARIKIELWPYAWFNALDPVRQDAIVDMAFMGTPKLLKFRKMIRCLESKDWNGAASEMLNSKWASQVKERAVELAEMIRCGRYPSI